MPELQWIEIAAGEATVRTANASLPPVGIAGWTLRFVVLDDFGGTVKLNKTPTIIDQVNGTFTIALTSAETYVTLGDCPAKGWAWEAWRIDSGGETRVAFGRLVVSPTAGVPV